MAKATVITASELMVVRDNLRLVIQEGQDALKLIETALIEEWGAERDESFAHAKSA